MDINPEYKPMDVATFNEKFARLKLRKRLREHVADLLRWLLQFVGLSTIVALAAVFLLWRFWPHTLHDWLPRVANIIQSQESPDADDEDSELLQKKLISSEFKRQLLEAQVQRLQDRNNKLEQEIQRLRTKK